MKIFYKCRCMPAEAELEVADRPKDADLLIWMGLVQATIGLDHNVRSPRCIATEMEYAKIPYDEHAPGIGVKRDLN
jgi:hypothetical protein